MAELFANSGDLDQTPRSAASDLGLHCLPVTLLQVSRLQWFNIHCLLPQRKVVKELFLLLLFSTLFRHNTKFPSTEIVVRGQNTTVMWNFKIGSLVCKRMQNMIITKDFHILICKLLSVLV